MPFNLGQKSTTARSVHVRSPSRAYMCIGRSHRGGASHSPTNSEQDCSTGRELSRLGRPRLGSQGDTCLPTSTGGTAWNPTARPEATLFTDFFGQQFQIITHFQSINEDPDATPPVPLSGNATWQSSLDSSRVWMEKSGRNPCRLRPPELPEFRLDSMPLVAVSRESEGAHGRETTSKHHLHPRFKYQRRSCSYDRLHGGADSAGAVHG